MTDFCLRNRLALVTGSGRGLGLAMARALGRAGATILVNDLDPERAREAAKELGELGVRAHPLPFDVTDHHDVARALRRCESDFGPLEVLVNNAGVHRYGPLESLSLADWQRVLDVNLTGAFLTAQAAVQGMLSRGRGKIVNICSLMSEGARPTTGNYAAAKGGLKMLTRAMAVEWGRHGVQANGIGPGYILSDMTRHLAERPEFDAWVRSRTPAGRWGQPEDLGGAVVFLCSGASDFVNGQVLYVDGGFLAAL